MWLWLGIGSIAAYVLMRSKEKRWTRSGKPQSGHFRGVEVRYDLDQIKQKSTVLTRIGVPLPSAVEFTRLPMHTTRVRTANWQSC